MLKKGMQRAPGVLLVLSLAVIASVSGDFTLTILHTNDVHARIEEADTHGGPCTAKLAADEECFGGVSRIRTVVNAKRREYPNATLLLDAGDQFQGTLWFYTFGGLVSAEFMNLIGYDAMTIGNHEFDRGIEGLVPFAHNLTFPLLASNMNLRNTPELQDVVNKSTVVVLNGHKIGIVGYTTTETAFLSSPGNVTFTDELKAVQDEIDILVSQNVNIIIGLGHSGYLVDLDLAKKLKHVDIIVGGHTNTFLYSGKSPSIEKASGEYPTVVKNVEGRNVLVVQDYAFGKYLGELHVTFNSNDEAVSWSGNPILLDRTVLKDNETEKRLQDYMPEIIQTKTEVIGETRVDLMSDRFKCRTTECNLGNFVADAVVYGYLEQSKSDPDSWTDVGIAFVNAGSFRASIPKGNITKENVIFVQPFRNTIEVITLTGQTIIDILEFAASQWTDNIDDVFAGFLQVSGLQITYDMDRPSGKRVVEVLAVCTKCLVPELKPLNLQHEYKVLTSAYLIVGGEGYSMLPDSIIKRQATTHVDTDVVINYIINNSPITTGLQGRIRHLKDIVNPKFCGGAGQLLPSFVLKFIPLLLYPLTYLLMF